MAYAGMTGTVLMLKAELLSSDDFDVNRMCATAHPTTGSTTSDLHIQHVVPDKDHIHTTHTVDGISRVADVVLALDNTYLDQHGGEALAIARAMRILNNVDALYRTELGIALNNIDIRAYAQNLPITNPDTSDPSILLENLHSSRTSVFGTDAPGFAALLTAKSLSSSDIFSETLGVANVGGICFSRALSVNQDRNSESVASVILAHEMGHNLGSCHDGDPSEPPQAPMHVCRLNSQSCPDDTHIMAPYIVTSATGFSQCSKNNIDDYLSRFSSCFKDPIDIALTRTVAAPTDLVLRQLIARDVIVENKSSVNAKNIQITGNMDDVLLAEFVRVTAEGEECMLLNDGQNYQCTIANVPADSDQTRVVEELQTKMLGTFSFTTAFEHQPLAQQIDVSPANQQLSDTHTVVLPAAPPAVPDSLGAFAQSNGNIWLIWIDSSSSEAYFRIRRSSGDGWVNIAVAPSNTTSYMDPASGLTAGTEYAYEVVAENTLGAASSNSSSATALQPPARGGIGGGGGSFCWITGLLFVAWKIRRSFQAGYCDQV